MSSLKCVSFSKFLGDMQKQTNKKQMSESHSFGGCLESVLFIFLASSLDHILATFYLDKSLNPPGSLPG